MTHEEYLKALYKIDRLWRADKVSQCGCFMCVHIGLLGSINVDPIEQALNYRHPSRPVFTLGADDTMAWRFADYDVEEALDLNLLRTAGAFRCKRHGRYKCSSCDLLPLQPLDWWDIWLHYEQYR
ncbi:MAG: hypothetical protein ACXABY_03685 [Candidatus Thorarchaeota archaeon]|jgi:hypothetical protein